MKLCSLLQWILKTKTSIEKKTCNKQTEIYLQRLFLLSGKNAQILLTF